MSQNNLPNHIAIIPDGNRRWARARGLPSFEGHRRGFEVSLRISKYIRSLGVHTMTFWAFSTENWSRAKEEIGYLMRLYAQMADRYLKDALKENIKVVHLGRKDRIPGFLLKKIINIEEKTKNNTENILNIALDYGGKDEVLRAIKRIGNLKLLAPSEAEGEIGNLAEENFPQFLDTAGQPFPSPDLIIRTSGEMRTSGFMIWQAAYSEYYFLKKHLPDLSEKDIDDAIEEFSRRQRRFGK